MTAIVEFTYPQILALEDNKSEKDDKGARKQLIFSGGVRFRWNPIKNVYEVLILDYHRDGVGELQIKFPGGCSELGETARKALYREMITETGRPMRGDSQIIHYDPIMNKQDSSVLEHIKVFFVQEVLYADQTPFLKTATGSDNSECSPVYWAAIDQNLIDKIFRNHKTPLKKLVRRLHDAVRYETNDSVRFKKIQSLILTI